MMNHVIRRKKIIPNPYKQYGLACRLAQFAITKGRGRGGGSLHAHLNYFSKPLSAICMPLQKGMLENE